MSRSTASRLQIVKHRLGFRSIEELLRIFERATIIQCWTKEDLLNFATPVHVGTASSEEEIRRQLGFKQKTKVKAKVKEKDPEGIKGVNDE